MRQTFVWNVKLMFINIVQSNRGKITGTYIYVCVCVFTHLVFPLTKSDFLRNVFFFKKTTLFGCLSGSCCTDRSSKITATVTGLLLTALVKTIV